jgi:hypothetical protein
MKTNNHQKLLLRTNLLTFIAVMTAFYVISCTKERTMGSNVDNYQSTSDFYNKNGVALQNYSVDAAMGGAFTTPQGTVISIPPNAFTDPSGNIITGKVDIEFKDIYKKSDMLLSFMPTDSYGWPLKSAGEFFIRAKSNNTPVKIAPQQKIQVNQPLNNNQVDSGMGMMPFFRQDSVGWRMDSANTSLEFSASSYIFSLYQFSSPLDSGTWCNSDNPYYFGRYTTTSLTIHENDAIQTYGTDVFLLFKNVNSMVHVYRDGTDFPYQFAPLGLDCTIVAVGVKDKKLYSAFIPITIGNNQTVKFSLNQTTTDDFKAQLNLLND